MPKREFGHSDHDSRANRAVLDEREQSAGRRDSLHVRIDLEESPLLSWFRVAENRAGAESNRADYGLRLGSRVIAPANGPRATRE